MKRYFRLTQLAIGLLGLLLASYTLAEPPPETVALIEELGLIAGDKPISEHPAWQPRRVLVNLPAVFSSGMPELEQQLRKVAGEVDLVIDISGDSLPSAEKLAGADGFIGLCTPSTMANADERLLWLHSITAGMDRCTGLSQTQIEQTVFTNGKRLWGPAIAEHTIAMMMSLARGLPSYQQAQAKNQWDRSLSTPSSQFGEVRGKTMLIVGLGGIGSQIAWRAHGLGMRVIATRNTSRSGPDYVDYVGLPDELTKLAGEANVIVNALPLTSNTRGLFDKNFFANAKAGAIFLSVGRGESTVTEDLINALESGHLYAAGLDVTDPEPLAESSPLWNMRNVIITPHVSAITRESMRRAAIITVENFRRYVAGEALLNVVNIQAGY